MRKGRREEGGLGRGNMEKKEKGKKGEKVEGEDGVKEGQKMRGEALGHRDRREKKEVGVRMREKGVKGERRKCS